MPFDFTALTAAQRALVRRFLEAIPQDDPRRDYDRIVRHIQETRPLDPWGMPRDQGRWDRLATQRLCLYAATWARAQEAAGAARVLEPLRAQQAPRPEYGTAVVGNAEGPAAEYMRRYAAERAEYRAFFEQLPAQEPPPPTPSFVVEEEKMANRLNSFYMGTDPEFVVVDTASGGAVNADHYVPQHGEVGWDHSGRVWELRPEKAFSTYTLLRRMRRLLNDHPRLQKAARFAWKAGALFREGGAREPLGGHIHFSFKPPALGQDDDDEDFRLQLLALDRLTRHFEKLDLLPAKDSIDRRRNYGYGKWGDWRPSGSDQHFEYRTPASWLYDPTIAYLVLTGAKCAAVAAETTLAKLPAKNFSREALADYFGLFKSKDDDVARAVEKVNFLKLRPDPSIDFQKVWRKELPL